MNVCQGGEVSANLGLIDLIIINVKQRERLSV